MTTSTYKASYPRKVTMQRLQKKVAHMDSKKLYAILGGFLCGVIIVVMISISMENRQTYQGSMKIVPTKSVGDGSIGFFSR